MELFLKILWDAVLDSVKMLPFLFGAYLLLEYLENRQSERMTRILSGSHGSGPAVGALLGCVPQCGFSVAAANLYAGRAITLGTLLAVFIATSDEAIPILLSRPDSWGLIGGLLLAKALLGAAVGLLADLFFRRRTPDESQREHEEAMEGLCADCDCEHGIFRSALHHTVSIFLFILVTNIVLGGCVELLGEETLSRLLLGNSLFQPVVAAVVGLIPNCAASVILTSLFLEGTLSFGALLSGLVTGAGVGLVVLLRMNKHPKENLAIIALLVAIGSAAGILVQLVAG